MTVCSPYHGIWQGVKSSLRSSVQNPGPALHKAAWLGTGGSPAGPPEKVLGNPGAFQISGCSSVNWRPSTVSPSSSSLAPYVALLTCLHRSCSVRWGLPGVGPSLFYLFTPLYRSAADEECCYCFRCMAKGLSRTYTRHPFPPRLLCHLGCCNPMEQSSRCYTVGPCWLSIFF